MIESLESRRLLAASPATAVLTAGVLTVTGSKNNDVIVVAETSPGTVHVELNQVPVDFAGVTAIKISGMGGDDTITYTGQTIGADVHGDSAGATKGGSKSGGSGGGSGGKGNDFITIFDDNNTGASTVDGDKGNDTLHVYGHSQLNASDTLSTQVFGGDGDDFIYVNENGLSASRTMVFAEAGKDTVTVYGGVNTLSGGDGKDTLIELGGVNSSSGFEVIA
jgi:hypothetical protein